MYRLPVIQSSSCSSGTIPTRQITSDRTNLAYELTMIVSCPTALERDTWGSIKSTF
jgi:hypothetical protein